MRIISKRLSVSLRTFFPLLLSSPLALAQATAPVADAVLSPSKIEARGEHSAILTVSRYGRYSLSTKSAQGTSLQIVDRMSGPGELAGAPGERDGRIDLYLDAGRYKVITRSHDQGHGSVDLSVHPFKEINDPRAPVLIELKPIEGSLEDYQKISYWIEIKERHSVYLEAEGRDLADMRLWQDGSWLVDAAPDVQVRESMAGRPQTYCALIADLTPGYYLVTAYGGAPKAWAKESTEHPFHVRYGIRQLPTASRLTARLSPFGLDRYLLPRDANFFLLQLPEKKDFRLDVQDFEAGNHFSAGQASAVINKKSQDPECLIERQSRSSFSLVTVTGAPGERYDLQIFQKGYSHSITRPTGDYWISTIHSGYMDDNIDATGILVSNESEEPRRTPVAEDVIHIGSSTSWVRRFNLLGDNTIMLFVEEQGDYEVVSKGTTASFRFEPFMIWTPDGYESPGFKPSGSIFSLDRGFWTLSIHPELKGILDIAVQKKGGTLQRLLDKVTSGEAPEPGAVKGNLTFKLVHLDERYTYTLYSNQQEGVIHGLVIRPYPLSIDDALPVVLMPAEEQIVTFYAGEDSQLAISAAARIAFTATVDGTPCQGPCAVSKGSHNVSVRNTGTKTQVLYLQTIPVRLLPQSGPVFLATGVEESFPKFPTLAEKAPIFADYGVLEQKTFLLRVDTPALYRVETTGLLKTACTVRTRVKTKLFSAEANGVGRNALVQQFLKEGEYQVTVRTLDRSAGHAGIGISRTGVVAGGTLLPGKEAKDSVPAGSAVEYTFAIAKAGSYKIDTIGQRKTYRCRIEDSDGWPLRDPSAQTGFTQELPAGQYHYMTLPWDVDTLRVTRLDEVVPERRAEGRGPHQLFLNESLPNVWREPAGGRPRERDLYDVTIPAPLDATIALGNDEMQGFLKRESAGTFEVIDTIPPGKPWTGALDAGVYRIEVESGRANDYLEYAVLVTSQQLVAGVSKKIQVPSTVDVSLGKDGVAELFSQGPIDVRAALVPQSGADAIESNDDSFNDWNFRIAHRLAAGRYNLQVNPVGVDSGTTTVTMNVPDEILREETPVPSDAPRELDGKINIIPIADTGAMDLLSVRASGSSYLGCILEKVDGASPATIAEQTGRVCQVTAPLEKNARYQLRLWSADHQSETARLQLGASAPPLLPFAQLEQSFDLTPAAGPAGYAAVARFQVPSAGTFRVTPSESLWYATREGRPLMRAISDLLSLPAGVVTMKWESASAHALRVRASRHILRGAGSVEYRTTLARGEPQWLDVANENGGFTVVTARSTIGRPACVVVEPSAESASPPLDAFALDSDSCATVALPRQLAKVRLWDADSAGPVSSEVTVDAERFPLLPAPKLLLAYGDTAGDLAGRGQREWVLPPGEKQIDLALDPGVAAVAWDGAGVRNVAFAGDSPLHRRLMTRATGLALLNTRAGTSSFECRMMKSAGENDEPKVAQDRPFERIMASPGVVRLQLPSDDTILSVAGDDVTCEWLDDQGYVHAGSRHELGGRGGTVTITHGTGLVKVWLSKKGAELAGRWGQVADAPIPPIHSDSLVTLDGESRWYGVTLSAPSVVHFSVQQPCVIAVSRSVTGSLPQSTSALLQLAASNDPFLYAVESSRSTTLDYFLERGNYAIGVRALSGGKLSGTAEYSETATTPITAVRGPDTLLAGGESKTFSFTVAEKETIGIGVRADREVIGCELLTRDERRLAAGIQQFVELDPGIYLLRITAPPGEIPVHFTPVVVGLEPPGIGPPEEYLREFFNQIGLAQDGRTTPESSHEK